MRRFGAVVVCALAVVPAASAPAAKRHVLLGVLGNRARMTQLTGQSSAIGHVIVGWEQGRAWGAPMLTMLRQNAPHPMIGLDTGRGWPHRREAITSRAIALGQGDAYLFAINRAIAAWRGPVFLRPFGEMNGHWNFYCAYNANGSRRSAAHSTRWFRKAFARIYLIAHGGTADEINPRLRRLGLPPIATDLAVNPAPLLQVVWNPQGFGNPDVPGNSAAAYYPGDAFADVIGDDVYDQGYHAQWPATERLYRAHPRKPFAFPEWGLWGIDDPPFVEHMARFVRSHGRVIFVSWFESRRGSIFDLASKPRSRAAYRRLITPLGR
jgi:hypothetical protein